MQETYPLALSFPTRVINLEEDKVLASRPPETVRVQMVGQGVSLFQVYYNRPTITLDASQIEIDIEAAELGLPTDVRIESVTPRTYVPILEDKKERKIPVRLDADITLPEYFDYIVLPEISPDSVTIIAGESVVDSLDYWPTELFELRGFRDTLVTSVALKDTLNDSVILDVQSVELRAVAKEFTGAETTVEVDVRGAPSDKKLVTLDPSTVTIRYRVLLDQFSQAQQSTGFGATVDYNDIRSDTTGSVQPSLILPPNLELRDVDFFPQTLRYYNYLTTE